MDTVSAANGSAAKRAKPHDPFSPTLQKAAKHTPTTTARSTLRGYITWLVMCLMPFAAKLPFLHLVVRAYVKHVSPKSK